jgi:hypothetical protein
VRARVYVRAEALESRTVWLHFVVVYPSRNGYALSAARFTEFLLVFM